MKKLVLTSALMLSAGFTSMVSAANYMDVYSVKQPENVAEMLTGGKVDTDHMSLYKTPRHSTTGAGRASEEVRTNDESVSVFGVRIAIKRGVR